MRLLDLFDKSDDCDLTKFRNVLRANGIEILDLAINQVAQVQLGSTTALAHQSGIVFFDKEGKQL